MARTAKDVTEAELGVMDVLWQQRRSTVREISSVLYPRGSSSHHATVQKLLDRLRKKDFVRRDASVWPHAFAPAIEKAELVVLRLKSTAEQLSDGRLVPLLSHLFDEGALDPNERQSLRELLDKLEPVTK